MPWASGVRVSEKDSGSGGCQVAQGQGVTRQGLGMQNSSPNRVLMHEECRAPPRPPESGSACRQASH